MAQIIAIMLKCGLKNVHGRELLTILLVLIMGMLVEVQVEERRFWL